MRLFSIIFPPVLGLAMVLAALALADEAPHTSPLPAQIAVAPAGLSASSRPHLVSQVSLAWPKGVQPYYKAEVVLNYDVDTAGHATNIRAAGDTYRPFVDAALDCLKQWSFTPAMQHGEPVSAHGFTMIAKFKPMPND